MSLDYTKKTTKRRISVMDVLHTFLGTAEVVLFIIMAVSFDKNRRLLPFIMLIAAVMNAAEAIYKIQHIPRGKKNISGILLSIFLSAVMLFAAGFMWIVFYW